MIIRSSPLPMSVRLEGCEAKTRFHEWIITRVEKVTNKIGQGNCCMPVEEQDSHQN